MKFYQQLFFFKTIILKVIYMGTDPRQKHTLYLSDHAKSTIIILTFQHFCLLYELF